MARIKSITQRLDANRIKIEPMQYCLHGRYCEHFDSPGDHDPDNTTPEEVGPMCELEVDGIFNFRACPLGFWKF